MADMDDSELGTWCEKCEVYHSEADGTPPATLRVHKDACDACKAIPDASRRPPYHEGCRCYMIFGDAPALVDLEDKLIKAKAKIENLEKTLASMDDVAERMSGALDVVTKTVDVLTAKIKRMMGEGI